jgi:two-component system KDP operon response regulator KdpE
MKLRVLVVDDEPQILRFLEPALSAAGYDVLRAASGKEALRMIRVAAPDMVVLDIGLPDMDGKEVLQEARNRYSAPILMLSARDREAEKIAALDLGADDYIEKPFAIGELLARLRAACRHHAGRAVEATKVEFGGLTVDLIKRRVTKNGALVKLTPREYDVLSVLGRSQGRVVTHERILRQRSGVPRIRTTCNICAFSLATFAQRSRPILQILESSRPNWESAIASRKLDTDVCPELGRRHGASIWFLEAAFSGRRSGSPIHLAAG